MRGVGAALNQDRELVPADPGHRVTGPDGVHQAVGDVDQQGVSDRMTEGVVDQLEVVEVQRDHADRRPMALPHLHRVGQAQVEQGPVGQAGEGVVQRLLGHRGQQPPVLPDRHHLPDHHRDDQQRRHHFHRAGEHDGQWLGGHHHTGQQQRGVRQQDRRPAERLRGALLGGGGVPPGGRRDRDQQETGGPPDVHHAAAGVLAFSQLIGISAVGQCDARQAQRQHGQHQALFHRGPHQHHRGDRQDQQIGDRIGERDDEVQAIRLRLVVEPFQDGDPADQEQRAGHDDAVDQHPPAGAGIALGGEQQQPHAGTDREQQERGVGRGREGGLVAGEFVDRPDQLTGGEGDEPERKRRPGGPQPPVGGAGGQRRADRRRQRENGQHQVIDDLQRPPRGDTAENPHREGDEDGSGGQCHASSPGQTRAPSPTGRPLTRPTV